MDRDENQKKQEEEKKSDIQRRPIADSNKIDELRDRLYSRGVGPEQTVRHSLYRESEANKRDQEFSQQESIQDILQKSNNQNSAQNTTVSPDSSAVMYSESMATKKNRRSKFRKIVTIFGVVFFVVAVAIASVFMFWGNKTISGNNISIKTSGPISIGGGEELSFQVSIANQNAVPIESATLIINYPKGTKSPVEKSKELSLERIPLTTIDPGELVNIPLKAIIYGEEDEEKEIQVRIEYRVSGSNATFEKESSPLMFKVSTSPIVMTFDSVKSISSGQEFELVLTVQSNSPTPLSNLLIKAAYPIGFDYSSSDPDTISGEDTWSIETLKPNERQTITIRGLITGGENEVRTFDVNAGVGSERDGTSLISQLASARTEVFIEQAFLDVNMEINGSRNENVVIDENSEAFITMSFVNNLETTIYDGKIIIKLDGNALDEFRIKDSSGFYDSVSNTITWDGTSEDDLREILPGKNILIQFKLDPKSNVGKAPKLDIKMTFQGQRRVYDTGSSQELVGLVSRTIKVESVPKLESEVLYGSGPFTNTGPVPPVAEVVTQYTYMLSAEAGINDVTDTEVTAVLPQYMSWLDLTDGDGSVTYNATTRTMKWSIGNIDATEEKKMYAQVSLRPSLSQVDSTPTLLGTQNFKATDRFTGTTVRVDSPALTTSLQNESDKSLKDGKVREPD